MKTIYLAGGCFWGTQHYIKQIKGVVETQVGYANGRTENPSYQEVCKNNTGHAETVKVVYDPAILNLKTLLELYFIAIDPTSVNQQGEDVGTQYRTGIFYESDLDLPIISQEIEQLSKKYSLPIAVEVKPLDNFYLAEDYHQDYLDKNLNGYCHLKPELFEFARRANASEGE